MLEVLKKQFLKVFPDGKGIKCFYSGLEVVPLTHAGDTMLSFDQGNPTLKSDDPGQTWVISTWLMNKYKNDMSPVAFKEHMNYIFVVTMTRLLLMLCMNATMKGKILKILQLHDCLLKVHLQNKLLIEWEEQKKRLISES